MPRTASGAPLTRAGMALLIFAVSGGVLGVPAAWAQRKEPVRIGVLTDSWGPTPATIGLRDGLQALGYREDEHFHLGIRFTRGDIGALPAAARDLLAAGSDIIFATSTSAARAAQQATTVKPIVFAEIAGDPVRQGLVRSIARPGGNVTGVTNLTSRAVRQASRDLQGAGARAQARPARLRRDRCGGRRRGPVESRRGPTARHRADRADSAEPGRGARADRQGAPIGRGRDLDPSERPGPEHPRDRPGDRDAEPAASDVQSVGGGPSKAGSLATVPTSTSPAAWQHGSSSRSCRVRSPRTFPSRSTPGLIWSST